MKVIDGNFGDKKEEDIDAPTFLATLALRAGDLIAEKRDPKVVVIFYEEGHPLEITATEPYPEGIYFVLGRAKTLIELEAIGVV